MMHFDGLVSGLKRLEKICQSSLSVDAVGNSFKKAELKVRNITSQPSLLRILKGESRLTECF